MPVPLQTHHNISDITTCVVRDASVCANIPNTTIGDNTLLEECHRERSLTLLDANALWGRDRGQNKVVRAATFTQLWAHATHITWTLHW